MSSLIDRSSTAVVGCSLIVIDSKPGDRPDVPPVSLDLHHEGHDGWDGNYQTKPFFLATQTNWTYLYPSTRTELRSRYRPAGARQPRLNSGWHTGVRSKPRPVWPLACKELNKGVCEAKYIWCWSDWSDRCRKQDQAVNCRI